jgi:Holliday junction DNA helicase RuvA
MIATLEGTLQYRGEGYVIVNVGGIGFQVCVSGSTLNQLKNTNGKVVLYTHLQLREDSIVVYGFASPEELALFRKLVSVSGVGSKIALSLLSAMNQEQLVTAISTGNEELLARVPGVGKKIASRIVLELRGKLERERHGVACASDTDNADIILALTSLGYSLAEASKAVSRLPSSRLSLEEKIKIALQEMARG